MQPKILIIIPARGGSKGIARKNIRPLNDIPLIYYAINNGLSSQYNPDVFVSTDDDEISFFAKKFGSKVHLRPKELGNDSTTLDPVIVNAYENISKEQSKEYDFVITMQPTSPLLSVESLDAGINQLLLNPDLDTVISVINDTHLTWIKEQSRYTPNYKERVNRQFLPQNFKETGGFLISKATNLTTGSRIGENVTLFELNKHESIDIDSHEDWALCEYYLKQKHILFRVSGYNEIGLGHIYNCLIIANEILNHRISFIVDNKSELGFQKIRENNFTVYHQLHENIIDDITLLKPDLVINDCLDTSEEYVSSLKAKGFKVVNIEDLGEGSKVADLVFNAIYPEIQEYKNHYFGPEYFCARDEFLFHPKKEISPNVNSVLITFGGVDPNNLTLKVLESIYDFCTEEKIQINIITGLGYQYFDTLKGFSGINVLRNVKNISDHFFENDIAFSSAGRTIYELAIIGIPSIVLAQNERELTHFFAHEEYGFINMGLGIESKKEQILAEFKNLTLSSVKRTDMSLKMLNQDISKGKKKVINLIYDLLKMEL
jgi:CMP-N-acetylneuraminic acid synthetase/spore coat polysaccharide biosynthesis predicted glycosyltransferase SpsG